MRLFKLFISILLFLNFSFDFFNYSYNTIRYFTFNNIGNVDLIEIKYYTYFTPTYQIHLYEKINTNESKEEIKKLKNRTDYKDGFILNNQE